MDVFERATALAGCAVLERVPAPALLAVAERTAAISLGAGEPLPLRTDAGDAVLVIVSGRVQAGLAELGPGRLVGELGAIDEEAAPLAATAVEPAVVLRLYRDDFLDLLAEQPAVARALAADLAARVRLTEPASADDEREARGGGDAARPARRRAESEVGG